MGALIMQFTWYKIPLLVLICLTAKSYGMFQHKNFTDFHAYCASQLPTHQACVNARLFSPLSVYFKNTSLYQKYRAIDANEFGRILDLYFNTMNISTLTDVSCWVEGKSLNADLVESRRLPYKPYAQKMIVEPENSVLIRGDMHGDIHSLLFFLQQLQQNGDLALEDGFKITNPRLRLIFLGDYVDRGVYGVEVMYTILRLKIDNPEQVILVRGNHEDITICSRYGFFHELQEKFHDADEHEIIINKIAKFYETLPVALYLGCHQNDHQVNYLQCCHGGIEIGFDPQPLLSAPVQLQYHLLGELKQIDCCKKLTQFLPPQPDLGSYKALVTCCKNHLPKAPTHSEHPYNGFMWNDFNPESRGKLWDNPGRAITYSKEITESALLMMSSVDYKLCGVIRAHQHALTHTDPLMRQMLSSHGVARLWSENKGIYFNPWHGMVCTLLLSPDNSVALKAGGFVGFDYDTTLSIIPAHQFTQWNMQIINNQIYGHYQLRPQPMITQQRPFFCANSLSKSASL